MKSTKIILIFLVFPTWIYSQTQNKIITDFKLAKNDSIFITNNSLFPYKIYSIDKSGNYDSTNIITKRILAGKIGDVIGPFNSDSIVNYVKIIKITNAYKIRVGNIWIDIKRGYDNAKETANKILNDVKNGKDYNTFCYLYSDDRNKLKDCDLGWFYNTIMVEPFANDIIKHKLGDVFVVETKFGFHVVKILGDPYLVLMRVDYITLTNKK